MVAPCTCETCSPIETSDGFRVGDRVTVRPEVDHPERAGQILSLYQRIRTDEITRVCAWVKWDGTNVVTGVPLETLIAAI